MADYNEVASMLQNLIQEYFEFSDFVVHGELDILKVFHQFQKEFSDSKQKLNKLN